MSDKEKKSESPTCACGRADLYEEFLKNQKEENKDKDPDSSAPKRTNKAK